MEEAAEQFRWKVAFAYDCCDPFTVGGAETHYRGLTEELAERGHSVTYITSRFWHGPAELDRNGVRLLAVTKRHGPKTGMRTITAALRYGAGLMVHLFRHGAQYDVVEAAALPPTAAIAAWLGLLRHRSTLLVTDWHEVWPRSTWIEEFGVAGNLGWITELIARRIGLPATFSELHARRLHRPAAHVPEFISITPSEDEGLSQRDPTMILCVGRMVANKRFALVPAALAELNRRQPDHGWRVVFVGSGPEQTRVESAAAAEGVTDSIEFDRDLSAQDLSRLFSTAAVLLHPSRREGFGIVVLEASAHELPAVVCREVDNAAVELISHATNGAIAQAATSVALADAVQTATSGADPHGRTKQWWFTNKHRFTASAAADSLESLWKSSGSNEKP